MRPELRKIENEGPNWLGLSNFAITHKLPTDAVYLGRIDPKAFRAAQETAEVAMSNGIFDRGAIYGLETRAARRKDGQQTLGTE